MNPMVPRTWLLSGVPRSGTSLCCRLAGDLPDTVALSEPIRRKAFGGMDTPCGACARIGDFAGQARARILAERRADAVFRSLSRRGEHLDTAQAAVTCTAQSDLLWLHHNLELARFRVPDAHQDQAESADAGLIHRARLEYFTSKCVYPMLLLFRKRKLGPYWFETGTPTFLVQTLFERRVSTVSLGETVSTGELLSAFDVEHIGTLGSSQSL